MSKKSDVMEAMKEKHGRDLPVLDQLPEPKQLREQRSRIEFWTGAVGYQRGMLKTWDGKLLALIVIPAAVAGHLNFWEPKLEVAYTFAQPYISTVSRNAVELSDRLIAFGNLPDPASPIGSYDDTVVAAIIPETSSPNPRLIIGHQNVASLTLWRITQAGSLPFDASGTTRNGGIYSPPGVPAIYAADSPLGSINEVSHYLSRLALKSGSKRAIGGFVMHQIVAKGRVFVADVEPVDFAVNDDWSRTQKIGSEWFQRGTAPLLGYPSRFAPKGLNYVLLPDHSGFEAEVVSTHALEPFIV